MWLWFVTGLTAGIAATPHCLGMCGGFPLYLSKPSSKGSVGARLALFVTGKTFTYVFLGTLAASLGAIIFANTKFASFRPFLPLIAGLVTVLLGLVMLGLRLPQVKLPGAHSTVTVFRSLLDNTGMLSSFVLGTAVGFLPCPLPMAMLLLAVGFHSVTDGMALMAGVGVGTAPGLIAVGLLGSRVNRSFAGTGLKLAGAMVVAVGLLTFGHAAAALVNADVPSCCR